MIDYLTFTNFEYRLLIYKDKNENIYEFTNLKRSIKGNKEFFINHDTLSELSSIIEEYEKRERIKVLKNSLVKITKSKKYGKITRRF